MILRPALVALTAALTLSGGLVMAANGTETRRDLLIRTIEQQGCKMSEETAEKILPPLGFVPEETRAIVEELQAKGLAAPNESGSLILLTENCR